MRFRVSEKIMKPYVTLLNIFSEIALIAPKRVDHALAEGHGWRAY